jgi:TolA-binding protein
MKTAAVLTIYAAVLAAGAHAQGVNPTAPQAEDQADVGDVGVDLPVRVEQPATKPASTMSDTSEPARAEAYFDAAQTYEEHARDLREQLRELAERKYKERRAKIEANYKERLEPVNALERRRRLEAIEAFERFISTHSSDREFLPDAIFRLAELHYERIDDEFQIASTEYRVAYQRWKDAGSVGDQPVEPVKRFESSISLYRRLINEFPSYRLLDGAYYLLGYTLRQQGEVPEGMLAWRTLVERFPESRFFSEVWFRIGDQAFDDEDWPAAIAAFGNIVPDKGSEFYDKALYKLAWTFYLVNRFDDSVQRFFELLDFSYSKKRNGGEAGSLLEEEAVQYVAISLGDDNWGRGREYSAATTTGEPSSPADVDYVRFAVDYFKRGVETPRVYERDVMAKLGDNLFRQSKHAQAVAALERSLALDPLHRDAPKLQDQIVQCWVRERQFDRAAEARDKLVKAYAIGTPWARRFANDAEALKAAEDFGRSNLYGAALYYHQQASSYYEASRTDLAEQYFKLASSSYQDYLNRYPHDKNAYEFGYFLAETFYYSGRFSDAVAQYERIRDSTAGSKYRAESALNAVYSYEQIIAAGLRDGSLQKLEISADASRQDKPPEAIPELRERYIAAIDKFLIGGSEHDKAPAFGYRAGEVFYTYGHYPEAIRRFRVVVDRYPETAPARLAANFILDDLMARKDWKAAAENAALFSSKNVGGDDVDRFKVIQGGARFNIAKETLESGAKSMDEGKIAEGIALLESGAEQYLQLLSEDPKRETADIMMYNAALSLEKARRPLKAAELYERLYVEYPTSENAPEAMFRVANKNEQAFNFDKAVATYLALVKKYPDSKRRADAQINAALALEGQQKYAEAATEFERYATLFPAQDDAPGVFFRASLVHKRHGSDAAESAVLRRFIDRFGATSSQAPRVVEAWARIGDIAASQSSKNPAAKKVAVAAYKEAVARGQGNELASPFAAKAAFALAEDEYAAYERMKIVSRTSKAQVKELEAKSVKLTAVEDTYKRIITTYKTAEWSLASLYKIGSLYDNMQRVVLKSPCPDDIRAQYGDAGCDEYATAVEDNAFNVSQKAVANYQVAYNKAVEFRLANDWTKKTQEALNLLNPEAWPIDKVPLSPTGDGARATSLPIILPDGGAPDLRAVGLGPAEQQVQGGGN